MATIVPTRRGILGAMVIAPVAIVAPAVAAAPSQPYADLIQQLRDCAAWVKRLDAAPQAPDTEWEAWEAHHGALLTKVEALPLASDAVRVRAVAVLAIYGGDEMWEDDQTTATRLARQLIYSLDGEGR
ncbi:hypothetical protein [Sphingomonas adhaesiva]|uniref:hypothetical protein n=1 Tax=Sphingomonas adhaesiva TaxID=28212 RepID=UPI002FF99551